MKSNVHYIYSLLVIAFVLSGCVSTIPVNTPARTKTPIPSSTFIPPTFTNTPHPTKTATLTPPAMLEPEQAKDIIKTLLQEPEDCEAPCSWGIKPGKTTLGEAKNIFTHLGLQMKHTNTQMDTEFYEIIYKLDSGLSVSPLLTIQNDVVTNVDINISPETQKAGSQREWLAYSPETLVNRYGPPSKVYLFLGRGPLTSFTMDMYFDAVDLIVEYTIRNLRAKVQICPLTDQFESIGIWMGKNPSYPPSDRVPLEKVASLTMDEFSKLMTGDPKRACFKLKPEMFP